MGDLCSYHSISKQLNETELSVPEHDVGVSVGDPPLRAAQVVLSPVEGIRLRRGPVARVVVAHAAPAAAPVHRPDDDVHAVHRVQPPVLDGALHWERLAGGGEVSRPPACDLHEKH